MNQFRVWAIVCILIMAGSFAAVQAQESREQEIKDRIEYILVSYAEVCGSHPALRQHFRAVIQDGETQSDWLTHMEPICAAYAEAAGKTLNDALDDEEVPYTREDNH